ncbi:MAG: LPS export ABC transporter periplasmic protein LptC [Desulfurobacteriaceae bacterium]
MRSRLLKVAILLGIVSILPSIVLITRRETPPEKVSVRTNKEQVIVDFTLRSTGDKRWSLRSSKATFIDDKNVFLTCPQLRVLDGQSYTIEAESAIYDERGKKVSLNKVLLYSKNFKGETENGTYYVDKEVFKTTSFCKVVFYPDKVIEGKGCEIDLKNEMVIILSNVKSTFGEVVR